MNDNGQDSKPNQDRNTDEQAKVSGNSPVSPVEAFDVGKIDEERRIFQNGDTDRTSNGD